jgi:hypothetical protein
MPPPDVENTQIVPFTLPPVSVVAVPPVTVPEAATSTTFVSPAGGVHLSLFPDFSLFVVLVIDVRPVLQVMVDDETFSTPVPPVVTVSEQPDSVSEDALPFRLVQTTLTGFAVFANAALPGTATARAADPAIAAQRVRRTERCIRITPTHVKKGGLSALSPTSTDIVPAI